MELEAKIADLSVSAKRHFFSEIFIKKYFQIFEKSDFENFDVWVEQTILWVISWTLRYLVIGRGWGCTNRIPMCAAPTRHFWTAKTAEMKRSWSYLDEAKNRSQKCWVRKKLQTFFRSARGPESTRSSHKNQSIIIIISVLNLGNAAQAEIEHEILL